MSADVPQVSKGIIAKLVEDLRSVQLAQELVETGHVNRTIRVFANVDGMENCVIKISHGLESRHISFIVVIVPVTNWINALTSIT